MIEKRMQDATDKLWDDLESVTRTNKWVCKFLETRKRNRCTDKNS